MVNHKLFVNVDNNSTFRFVGYKSEIPFGHSKSFTIRNDKGKSIEVAIFNIDGTLHAISNLCIHKGGPLSEGFIDNDIVTCPWHGWKYSVKDGKSTHEGGDSVDSFEVKAVDDKVYVNSVPISVGKRIFQPHQKYVELEKSVEQYLKTKNNVLPTENNNKVRVLGISTTNVNDKVAPRKSTSEAALQFALDYTKDKLNAETVLLKVRDLEFKHCEGYYSKNAKACIFPCSISEIDAEDQMIKIYEKVILWADVVLISTPIRWGSSSSLYYKMIQRMNCVQNQITTYNRYLIRDKVAAFIITGGQDNIQHVAGELMSFWSQLGFVFGKFPFVGWSRGWYAEDTENNFDKMVTSISVEGKELSNGKNSEMYKDIVRMTRAAVEMANLLIKNQYDRKAIV